MKSLCTLSDRNYLLQGLALYFSLCEHSKDTFTLDYLCLDDFTYKVLDHHKLPNLNPIHINQLLDESDELRDHKDRCKPELGGGNNNEFCWYHVERWLYIYWRRNR